MPFTPHGLDIAAECVGFVSSVALSWQSFRLVRHLRAVRDLRFLEDLRVVRDLRLLEERKQGHKLGELAGQGAETLEKTIARWDARDQWLVVIGLVGIAISFLLKLIGLSVQ
jgi:hypothetical protein